MMQLTDKQRKVLEVNGHLLVTGGPGSGKTTISILKAAQIAEYDLQSGQKVLFLSFARATVSRVQEAIEFELRISPERQRTIKVETYHSFFWRILRTHGYLIGLPRRLRILTPPNEAIVLSDIRLGKTSTEEQKAARMANEESERIRLATAEGLICFDFFARYASDILHGSERIRKLVATMYPVIILDEFQDTNADQWKVVQALGEFCTLVSLADPEQRIYDWIGADSERLCHFREAFSPIEVDLSTQNHRSPGTEIAAFGNDVLKGNFRQKYYKGVHVYEYPPNLNQAHTILVAMVNKAVKRLTQAGIKDWSLAILVPTKKMTQQVSNALHQPPAKMPEVPHFAILEMEGTILGAEIIALLLQPSIDDYHFEQLIDLMCCFFKGKGGNEPTKSALNEAFCIRQAYENFLACGAAGKAIRKSSILVNVLAVYDQTRLITFSGDPEKDWRALERILENGDCKRLKEVANEVRNIHLLGRGSKLRQALSQDWRDNGRYFNALAITRQAFMQEHFPQILSPRGALWL